MSKTIMPGKRSQQMNHESEVESIIARNDRPGLVGTIHYSFLRSNNFSKDQWYLFPRLERAAANQCSEGNINVIIKRYANWAETVRDFIIAATLQYKDGNAAEGEALIIKAANSLNAFSELQYFFDGIFQSKRATAEARKARNQDRKRAKMAEADAAKAAAKEQALAETQGETPPIE